MYERSPRPLRTMFVGTLFGGTMFVGTLFGAGACALAGCSSNVQDLGREPTPRETIVERAPSGGLEGDPALIPAARSDLACPLSRPIEGASCGLENSTACTFVGAPEHSPDQPLWSSEITTTFCVCTAEQRWSCLQGVTMKTLVSPLHTGDACESGLIVERDGVICRCIHGEASCQ